MEYSVRVWSAIQGDVVPLLYVAEAMARCAATGYGTLPIHGPTLKNLRPERMLLLLDDVRNGQLTVCDYQGRVASAKELVETAKALADELAGAVPVEAMNAEAIIPFLHARRHHLIEWGKASGDVFLFVETPGTVVDSDLRNFTEAGFGEIIEAGYFRNAVGGGESEPWRDNLHTTTPAPVTVGVFDTVAPTKAGPLPLTTGDIAFCFAGLYWKTETEWKKPLGDKPKWLAACIVIPGVRGVSETRWNPVCIGAALVRAGHCKPNSVRAKFQTQLLLKPWLDEWKTYEADNSDSN